MSGPRDLRDLFGEDLPPEELERLARVDAVLRSVPGPPPEVPASLNESVSRISSRTRTWTRPRLAAAAALAAVLAALSFGAGRWAADEGLDPRRTVAMEASARAPGASASIKLGARDDETGNWELELDVSGLAPLEPGNYYVLWLAKDGEYAGTCGTFNVGPGETSVRMTASYRLADFDAWVISEWRAGEEAPWLLSAPIGT